MRELRDVKLKLIETYDEVADALRWLGQSREVLAFDTETRGSDWFRHKGNFVRLFQFGDVDSGFALRPDRHGALIEKIMTEYTGDIVAHNAKFDILALRVDGFSVPRTDKLFDTMLASRILDNSGSNALKDLAGAHFGKVAQAGEIMLNKAFELHGFRKSDKGTAFAEIGYDVTAYTIYSALDTVLTARLWPIMRDAVKPYWDAFLLELGAMWVTAEYEQKGLPVDLEFARELESTWESELSELGRSLEAFSITNPNSKAQQVAALMDDGWEPEEYTAKSGKPKLDKSIMQDLDHQAVKLLLEYSRINKWLASYVRPITASQDGFVYPRYNTFGAKTGRMSAYGPPVQQLPSHHEEAPKIRRMITARPGEELYGVDVVAEENCLLAHYSKDPALLKVIREGTDLHKYTAAAVYEIPYDQVTKEQRSISKTYNYASQYGAGIKKLAKGLAVPQEEVRRIKDRVDAAFPSVAAWKRSLENNGRQQYKETGRAWVTTWSGRRIYADQWEESEPTYYKLVNYQQQGTAADLLKEMMNRLAAADLAQYILIPIHDEIQFSVPRGSEGLEIVLECKKLMEFPTEFEIPIICDISESSLYWRK